MNRVSVNEPRDELTDTAHLDQPDSPSPNYITPSGYARLQARFGTLEQSYQTLNNQNEALPSKNEVEFMARELRRLRSRIQHAIVLNPAEQSARHIQFGAVVVLRDEQHREHTFTLVGEDESCAARKHISWISPLARVMLGKQQGERVIWESPTGMSELEILYFHYPT